MESNRKEYESLHPYCKGIVSGTISRLLHGLPESETHESASKTASLYINIFKAGGIEIIKTSIWPIVSLPELPPLALDKLSANSQEEL